MAALRGPFSFQAHGAGISFRGTLPGSIAEFSAYFEGVILCCN
jgi:hypothetical protein